MAAGWPLLAALCSIAAASNRIGLEQPPPPAKPDLPRQFISSVTGTLTGFPFNGTFLYDAVNEVRQRQPRAFTGVRVARSRMCDGVRRCVCV
jgi:hypothetical protein